MLCETFSPPPKPWSTVHVNHSWKRVAQRILCKYLRLHYLCTQICYFTVVVLKPQPEDTAIISQHPRLSITEGGNPLYMASTLHLEETFFGIAPHLYSLQRVRRNTNTFITNMTTMVVLQTSDSWCAALYPFAHADLHDSVVDERFPQIFVFLLLEALHVHPRLFNMLSAVKQIKLRTHTKMAKLLL